MTLVASPSTLSRHSSANDIGLGVYDSCSSLDEVTCTVERVPGFNYYKYRKEDGSSFLTTVSPKTWGPSCPHTFVKAYRETRSGVVRTLAVKFCVIIIFFSLAPSFCLVGSYKNGIYDYS